MPCISMSQLSTLLTKDINDNDILIISRTQKLGESLLPAISYKMNLLEFEKNISSDVEKYLETNWSIPLQRTITNNMNIMKNNTDLAVTTISVLSGNLTTDWLTVSSDLYNKYNTLSNEWSGLSVTITNDYNNFKEQVNLSALSALAWLSTYTRNWLTQYSGLSAVITSWVRDNFVNLSGDLEISGTKSFTKDIVGTALSAKWI